MTTKFKFTKLATADTDSEIQIKRLPKMEGSFETDDLDATVYYKFDNDDTTIKLTIEGQWFNVYDLEQLQSFIKAAKKQMQKIKK